MYALKIDTYSSKELETIFEKQSRAQANVTTDQWRGYRPLSGEDKRTQEKRIGGVNFKALPTMVHQLK